MAITAKEEKHLYVSVMVLMKENWGEQSIIDHVSSLSDFKEKKEEVKQFVRSVLQNNGEKVLHYFKQQKKA